MDIIYIRTDLIGEIVYLVKLNINKIGLRFWRFSGCLRDFTTDRYYQWLTETVTTVPSGLIYDNTSLIDRTSFSQCWCACLCNRSWILRNRHLFSKLCWNQERIQQDREQSFLHWILLCWTQYTLCRVVILFEFAIIVRLIWLEAFTSNRLGWFFFISCLKMV